jgi:response regulator RpfG family c-di-GMP phosphodiesterase
MNRKILFVDDEENVLRAFERNLRPHFEIATAVGPAAGLSAITGHGPYAVVISDLRMPGMDGIQFLSAVGRESPDSVRLIISGNADLQSAIAAVNEGSIFRFLTKPCRAETLRGAIDGALNQYRLVTAEREILEQTLSGTVSVLIELLGAASPLAFSRASRIRGYVRHIATQMELPDLWEFDLAAMLSQVGCIGVEVQVLEKLHTGRPLTPEERTVFASHPSLGRKLLAGIPRLEEIAQIVGHQMTPYDELRDLNISETVSLGAQMLMAAIRLDELVCRGESQASALKSMRESSGIYHPKLTVAMELADAGALLSEPAPELAPAAAFSKVSVQ